MISRRHLLAGAAASPLAARASAAIARTPEDGTDARLQTMLSAHAGGLREIGDDGLSLGDYSLAARALARQANAIRMAELATIDRSALSARGAVDYETARYVYATLDDQYGRYGFSDINLRPSPYVVSQMNGAYYWLPDGIGTRSPMANPTDADRYIARLEQLAVVLDQETDQILHDAGLGVVPPDFILARTVAQIAALRDTPATTNPLLRSALERAAAAGLEAVDDRAVAVVEGRIAPALTRQIEALQSLVPLADDRAGVWAQPDGEAYYVSGLHSNTTASYAPGEMHRMGLVWVRELSVEMDRLLRDQGLAKGSVGARMTMLDRDPRFLKPDTEAGRQEIIDTANARLDVIRRLLPNGFSVRPDDPVEVRRVPLTIQNGAPGGYYSASSDPEQPAVIYINLRSVGENALWRIPTLLHHEGIPGHHFQSSVLTASGELSLFRRKVRFSAWTEGWALYAEQLADEIGAYADDPFGRIGYLQGQLFRACRVVVDTGLHHARWTRDQAIDWMVEHAGEHRDAAEREIDRYCVYPGQACSFKVGQQAIIGFRARARAALGGRFDLRAYNDLILSSGPLPMEVLDLVVAQWTVSQAGLNG